MFRFRFAIVFVAILTLGSLSRPAAAQVDYSAPSHVVSISTVQAAGALQIDPRFPVAGKSTFGVSGWYIPEVVLHNPLGLNPAAQNMILDFKYPPLAQADFGYLSLRGGLTVDMAMITFAQRLSSRDTLRLTLYNQWTNSAPIPITGPLSIEHDSRSVEVAYAYRVSPTLDLGLAIVPQDRMDTQLSLGGSRLAHGSAHSTLQWRGGALWHKPSAIVRGDELRLGFTHGTETIHSSSQIKGVSGSIDGHFGQRHTTVGVGYQPVRGTMLFWNRQWYLLEGEGLDEPRSAAAWGLQQFVSPHVAVRVMRIGGGTSIGIGYVGNDWNVGASFTNRAFAPTESKYGKGSLFFLSVGKKF